MGGGGRDCVLKLRKGRTEGQREREREREIVTLQEIKRGYNLLVVVMSAR